MILRLFPPRWQTGYRAAQQVNLPTPEEYREVLECIEFVSALTGDQRVRNTLGDARACLNMGNVIAARALIEAAQRLLPVEQGR